MGREEVREKHVWVKCQDKDPVIASNYRIFWRALREIADRKIALFGTRGASHQ